MYPVRRLALVYMEPVTDEGTAADPELVDGQGFSLGFKAKVVNVALKPDEKTSGIKACRTFRFQLEPVVESDVNDSVAARSVFDINMMIVIGPTPPGTGVTAAAAATASS